MSLRFLRWFLNSRARLAVSLQLALLALLLALPTPSHAACGEELPAMTQELVAEEQALRTTTQAVRASQERMRAAEAQLQDLRSTPPETYDRTLARQLTALRLTEIEPKRRTLENLRAQHEESREQWERGHRLLSPQLVEAKNALQAKTITQDDFCRVRENYLQALRLYAQGMQNYRRGMELYARALDEYTDQFLTPSIRGFNEPQHWERLIAKLQQGDFLHNVLVPLTANAIRSAPPDAPTP